MRQSRPEQLVLGKVMKGRRDDQEGAVGLVTVARFLDECGEVRISHAKICISWRSS